MSNSHMFFTNNDQNMILPLSTKSFNQKKKIKKSGQKTRIQKKKGDN